MNFIELLQEVAANLHKDKTDAINIRVDIWRFKSGNNEVEFTCSVIHGNDEIKQFRSKDFAKALADITEYLQSRKQNENLDTKCAETPAA